MATNDVEKEVHEEHDDGLDHSEQSFVSHLKELRSRIMKALLCVLIVLLGLMPFANELYLWLADPLLVHMSATGATMIATEVASPFLAPFKLSVFVAVFHFGTVHLLPNLVIRRPRAVSK